MRPDQKVGLQVHSNRLTVPPDVPSQPPEPPVPFPPDLFRASVLSLYHPVYPRTVGLPKTFRRLDKLVQETRAVDGVGGRQGGGFDDEEGT